MITGRRLSQRYEIRRQLGDGGMAIVYEALDTLLDRPVAVKVLRPEFSSDEEFIGRFRREARAAAKLSHPNIVQVYDVGEDQGVDYIVMELVTGSTLSERIREEGALPVPVAVHLARQVLEALRHAHAQGVVHRDIKPQNILVTRAGQAKVTDFGIARATGAATQAGSEAMMGTVHYLSPEQARGRHTGHQSDLYSLGVVLYEMLTGVRPYDGDTPVSVAMKHLQERTPSPRSVDPRIPKTLERILFKALEKDPQRRYASAGDFLSDLIAYRTADPEDLIAAQSSLDETRVLAPLPLDDEDSELEAPSLQGPQATPPRDSQAIPPSDRHAARRGPRRGERAWTLSAPGARRLVPWTVGVLLAVFVFGGAAYAAYLVSGWLKPPLVEVPRLVGADVEDAASALEPFGVEVRVIAQRYDADNAAGVILSQDPDVGQAVRQGGTVEVIVSRGPRWVEGGVPDVRGMELREARIRLEQVGLQVDVEERYDDAVDEGRVVVQNPQAHTRVTAGTTVGLVVSLGPEPAQITLPNFTGRPLPQVRQELEELGLMVGEIRTQVSDYPKEYIRSQEPAPGTLLQPGQKVNLVVSQGSGSEPESTRVRVELPSTPARQQVEVWVEDRSERLVYSGEHEAGSSFEATVYWYPPRAEVRVFANGKLVTRTSLPQETERDDDD